MNRYLLALDSLDNPAPNMMLLSSNLYTAVIEASAYEHDPITDPAVLLLSMQISFLTHADVASSRTYADLVDACKVNAALPNINPKEVH